MKIIHPKYTIPLMVLPLIIVSYYMFSKNANYTNIQKKDHINIDIYNAMKTLDSLDSLRINNVEHKILVK